MFVQFVQTQQILGQNLRQLDPWKNNLLLQLEFQRMFITVQTMDWSLLVLLLLEKQYFTTIRVTKDFYNC
jgi:hypothetical protein